MRRFWAMLFSFYSLLGWASLSFLLLIMGCQSLKLDRESAYEQVSQADFASVSVKVALVLGGGGSKGLAHLGVIRELENAGIHPDLIVGCSSGALIGALYASHPSASHWEQRLIQLKRSDLLDFSLFAPRFSMVKGELLENFLHSHLEAETFCSLKIPLVVVATDLATGKCLELSDGDLFPALKASAAVPGIFQPVFHLGRFLVDGGVVNPVPVQVAKKWGAQVIIAVDVGERLSHRDPAHCLDVAKRGLAITHRALSALVARDADVILRMDFSDLGMFSDQFNREIYEQGRRMMRAHLPELEQMIFDRLRRGSEDASPS